MPTDLIATTSELFFRGQQLAVAAEPTEQGRRSGNLRIEIAVSVDVASSGSGLHFAGSIALKVNTG